VACSLISADFQFFQQPIYLIINGCVPSFFLIGHLRSYTSWHGPSLRPIINNIAALLVRGGWGYPRFSHRVDFLDAFAFSPLSASLAAKSNKRNAQRRKVAKAPPSHIRPPQRHKGTKKACRNSASCDRAIKVTGQPAVAGESNDFSVSCWALPVVPFLVSLCPGSKLMNSSDLPRLRLPPRPHPESHSQPPPVDNPNP